MGKRSRRLSLRHEKDQAGCISGLISTLHFRNGGFTRKFLFDRRHGSKRSIDVGYLRNELQSLTNLNDDCRGSLDHQGSLTETANAAKPCIKKLMEEDMISEQGGQKINRDEVTEKHSHNGHTSKNRKGTNTNAGKSSEVTINVLSSAEHSDCQNSQKGYTNTRDLDSIIEELCSHIEQKSICCGKHGPSSELYMHLKEGSCGFEAKLCEAIKIYFGQKFSNHNPKNLAEDGDLHSDQLMDALQIIDSNKELFLKLIKNPNSQFVKSLQILEGTEIEKVEKSKSVAVPRSELEAVTYKKTEELVNHRQHNFFRRKVKSQEKNSLEGNGNPPASNRIIIRKPGTTGSQNSAPESSFGVSQQSKELSDKVVSSFSLTKIKRKLKHVMGKERRGTSADVTLKEVLNERVNLRGNQGASGENFGRNSPSKDHFYIERHVKPSIRTKRGDKTSKPVNHDRSPKHEAAGHQQIVSNIYIEAKKHLSERLNNDHEYQDLSSRQVQNSLGQILCLPEFICSSSGSPVRYPEHSFVKADMEFSECVKLTRESENTSNTTQDNVSHLDPSTLNLDAPSCISYHDPRNEVKASNSDSNISDDIFSDSMKERSFFCDRDQMSSEGDMEIEEVKNTPFMEKSNVSDFMLGINSPSNSEHVQDDNTTEISHNEGYCAYSKQNSCEEQCSPRTSPKVEDLRSADGIIEQPSPVSVLELVLTEEEISPTKIICQPDNLNIQPLRINFEDPDCSATDHDIEVMNCIEDKESIYGYVNAVLQASGSSWDELYISSLSSDQLLHSVLFDEIQFFPNQLCHEQKLLSDCIIEVLIENCDYYFSSASLTKPSIRPISSTNKIQKVWEGVYGHLQPHPLPHTLDQIARKDLEKDIMWMDLRFDIEIIGAEKGDAILEEIIQDTILSLVNKITDNGYLMLPAELQENESFINL